MEDAAEATLRLYQLAQQIPNLTPEMMDDWEDLDEDALQTLPMTGDSPGDSMDVQMPQGESVPYESPQPVDFRGDFKPETVQLLMKLRQERGEKGPVSPLSPEQLKQMLEKSVEITLVGHGGGGPDAVVGAVPDEPAQGAERSRSRRSCRSSRCR